MGKISTMFYLWCSMEKDKTLVFNRYLSLMGRGNGKTGFASWNNFFLLTAKHGIKIMILISMPIMKAKQRLV